MESRTKELERFVAEQREKNTAYYAYSENEKFHFRDKEIFSVLDFWRYQYCQLSNLSEYIAEYLVARALGVSKAENLDSWTAYDLSYCNKRIEVKSTEYVHTWNKTKVSNVRTFSIAPTRNQYWGNDTFQDSDQCEFSRQSEVYVFCLNSNKDISKHDPLNLDTMEFYVVPTFLIDKYAKENGTPNQKTISLNVVKSFAEKADYSELRNAVDEAIKQSDKYYEGI